MLIYDTNVLLAERLWNTILMVFLRFIYGIYCARRIYLSLFLMILLKLPFYHPHDNSTKKPVIQIFIWTTGFIHTISTLEFKDSLVHSFYHFGFTIRRYFYYINTWFICQKYIIALRYNCFNQISVCWNNRNPAIRRTSR